MLQRPVVKAVSARAVSRDVHLTTQDPPIERAPSETTISRNFGLDVCRTTAILLVVVGHTMQHSRPPPFVEELRFVGTFGVDLFFALSGFLIGRILLSEAPRWQFASHVGTGVFTFWYRRWMRTLPLYYFWLLLSLEFDWRGETVLRSQAAYLLFAQNFAWQMPDFFLLSWSLAVEEWFYLSLPLVLMLFIGLGFRFGTAEKGAIAVFCIVPPVLRAVLLARGIDLNGFEQGARHVVVLRLDAIGFGVLMAYLYLRRRAWFDRMGQWWWTPALALLGVLSWTKGGYVGALDSQVAASAYFSLSAITFAALIPAFLRIRPCRFAWVNRFITTTSATSYSLYLGHVAAFTAVMWLLRRQGWYETVYNYPERLYPLFIAAAFALAAVTYHLVERPLLQFRDRSSTGAFHPRTEG